MVVMANAPFVPEQPLRVPCWWLSCSLKTVGHGVRSAAAVCKRFMFAPVGSLTQVENELNYQMKYLDPATALTDAASEPQHRVTNAREKAAWC